MAQPYVGEIRMFAGNFPPAGWAFCEGQRLPIAEYETLFQLIGTTYGGNGEDDFAVPDLRGRLPMHQASGAGVIPHQVGEVLGVEEVTLGQSQIPVHTHALTASGAPGTADRLVGGVVAVPPTSRVFVDAPGSAPVAADAVAPVGDTQSHTNLQPYLCVDFIISLFGIFPSPT